MDDRPALPAPRKGLATASLVLGVLSLPTLGLLLVGAMLGIVLGVAALVKAGREPEQYGGKGLAIAGLITSAASILVMPFVLGIVAAIAIPTFLRRQVSANESAAHREIHDVISREAAYAARNGGFYDWPECLDEPTACKGGARTPSLEPKTRSGYVLRFHPGPPASAAALANPSLSRSSLQSYAMSAVPVSRGRTGVRGFCGDATGRVCTILGSRPPAVEAGRCVLAEGAGASASDRCAAEEEKSPPPQPEP